MGEELETKPIIWWEDLEPFEKAAMIERDYKQEGILGHIKYLIYFPQDALKSIKYLIIQHEERKYMGFGRRSNPHSNIITKHREVFGIRFLERLIHLGYEELARGGGYVDVSLEERTIRFHHDSETFGKASQEDVDYIMSNAAPDWTWTYE